MLPSIQRCMSRLSLSKQFKTESLKTKKTSFIRVLTSRGSLRFYSDSQKDKEGSLEPSKNRNVSNKITENPYQRAGRILKADFNRAIEYLHDPDKEYTGESIFPSFCDVLIIGGGAIGSSAAFWLKQRAKDGLRVVVLERDSTVNNSSNSLQYKECSTCLSVGGLRQQFSLEENIRMSLFGAEFLRNIDDYLGVPEKDPVNINFTPYGYLFLASDTGAEILKTNAILQASLGAKNELLSPAMLKEKFPWLNTDGIALGCHGLENEGWFDPWSLLQAFKNKAEDLGTEYVKGELVGFNSFNKFGQIQNEVDDDIEFCRQALVRLPNGDVNTISFSIAVITAGPQSGEVAKLVGIGSGKKFRETPLPVEPRKRFVYCFHCPDGPGLNTPLTIDPTHTYFRREGLGGNYICGRSPPDNVPEPDTSNLEVDHSFFEEYVWPQLANRVPAFENLKVTSSWAGFYDFNSFDENAIIGRHPYYSNIYMATGCSGHGIQQSPALGRAIMELIINGQFTTIDLSKLGFERIDNKEPMYERNIV